MGGAIYADDSGNPGADSGSVFLPGDRKSWTAVIVPTTIAEHVEQGMKIFIEGVHGEFGVDELHFTEIYSGTGAWSTVSPQRRAEVIDLMAHVMSKLALPIVHQTVNDFTMLDHPQSQYPNRVGDWDLENLSQLALLMLCSGVTHHIRSMRDQGPEDFSLPFPLFVDEGIIPAGRERALPNWGDVIQGPRVSFRKSSELAGLQLADFAAFIISRSQWIAVKRSPGPISQADQVILKAGAGLNILNLPFQKVTPETFGKEEYEAWQSASRISKGLAPQPPTRR
ncbi:DUF3800 domain-containing protein [Ensifer sp.]|uniref:DUF3800 domain-containing protein n=1 Tax=Ensifer sp. TaxID=1872086 RepID=UPI0028983DF5|nr:DUF3800 domain-containing protein [Ensifer sp.]